MCAHQPKSDTAIERETRESRKRDIKRIGEKETVTAVARKKEEREQRKQKKEKIVVKRDQRTNTGRTIEISLNRNKKKWSKEESEQDQVNNT